MRPSGFGFAVNFTIVDHNGRFVGEAVAESHFMVTVPPGEYLFIADAENTDVVHANLAPGLVYYIAVAAQMGAFSAGVNMDPIKPTEAEWSKIPEYLSGSKRLISLLSAGQSELNADPAKLRKMVDDGKRKWAELSPADQALHALEIGDGAGPRPVPQPAPQYQAGGPPPQPPQYQPGPPPAGPPPQAQPPTAPPPPAPAAAPPANDAPPRYAAAPVTPAS